MAADSSEAWKQIMRHIDAEIERKFTNRLRSPIKNNTPLGIGAKMQKITLTASVVLALTICSSASGFAQKANTYQINAAHTGAIELQNDLKLPLRLMWSSGISQGGNVTSYPIIAGGKVFVVSGDNGVKGGAWVVALDTERNGANLWSRYLPGSDGRGRAGITFLNGRLFALSYSGLLVFLNPNDGKPVWSVQLPKAFDYPAPPVAHEDTIYVSAAASFERNGALIAVNATNGEIRWKKNIDSVVTGSPALSRDGVFVSTVCGVQQFDAITGALRWRTPGPCTGWSTLMPVFYSDRIFNRQMGSNGQAVRTYQAIDGALTTTSVDQIIFPPAFRGGVGYYTTSEALVARVVATGEVLWRFRPKFNKTYLPPIVVNGKVLSIAQGGKLSVLDGLTGAVLDQVQVGSLLPPSPEDSSTAPIAGISVSDEGDIVIPYQGWVALVRGGQK